MRSSPRAILWLGLLAAGCGESSAPNVKIDATPAKRSAPITAPVATDTLPPEERAEHHLYARWAKHPVGTKVVVKEVTTDPHSRSETLTTYTLKSKTDKVAVVTAEGSLKDPSGVEYKIYPQDFEYTRWVAAKTEKERTNATQPEGKLDEKEHTVTVLGKPYTTKLYVAKGHVEAGETLTRTWISDEIPGGVAKSERKVIPLDRVTTSEIVEIKIP